MNLLPDGWETNPEFPSTWNWELDAGYTKEQVGMVWERAIYPSRDFWAVLPAVEGGAEAVKQLNKLSKNGHDIYFLTHRAGKDAKRQTEDWLRNYGMETPTVLLTGDKVPIILNLGIKFFVDDKLETVNFAHRTIRDLGHGCQIYLKSTPYNQIGREKGLKVATSVIEALKDAELFIEEKRGRPRKS